MKLLRIFLTYTFIVKTDGYTKNGDAINPRLNKYNPLSYILLVTFAILLATKSFVTTFIEQFDNPFE